MMANLSSFLLKKNIHDVLLLTVGAWIISVGINSILIPHGFITGGISGLAMVCYYLIDIFPLESWYIVLNIPIFIAAWFFLGKKTFFYGLYGMFVLSFFIRIVNFVIPISDNFLAVLAGGVLVGLGVALTLYSYGSTGGSEILGVILNRKFGFKIGAFTFFFNIALFSFSLHSLEVDLVLYSLASSFCSGQVIDTVLTLFNQRKLVIIMTKSSHKITELIHIKLNRKVFLLHVNNANSTKKNKLLVLTIIHNNQIKNLENLVVTVDPNAIIVVENTYNVLGEIKLRI